jgi:hypothetical protein
MSVKGNGVPVVLTLLLLAAFCTGENCKAPDKKIIAHQIWLTNARLADDLAPYSPTMSGLIRSEQEDLNKEWCTQLRRGVYDIGGGHYVKWEMFLLNDGVHYRIKETEETLDIAKDKWVLNVEGDKPLWGILH